MIAAVPLEGLPEIVAGADLAEAISTSLETATRLASTASLASTTGSEQLRAGDVIAIAHKVVSKAEGRVRSLADVVPSERATLLAQPGDKDPRLVQVVLDETREVVRAAPGVII